MKRLFPAWLRRRARPVLVSAALLLGSWYAQAEGSRNLTPGTGTRGSATGTNNFVGYLQHNDGAVTSATSNSKYFLKAGAPANQRLYVRMNGTETLYFGVRRVRTNDGQGTNNGRLRLQLKYQDGATEQIASTHYLEARTVSTEGAVNLIAGQVGYIATPEEAAAGPRYLAGGSAPAAGYSPFVYTPAAGAPARDYWVEFMEVDAAGNATGVTQNKSWYDLWDFTVRDAVSEKPGRLYSQQWSFTAAGGANALSASFMLYPLIPNPNFNNQSFFVKRVSYAGIQPFGVILVANSQGTTVAGNFKDKRKSQSANTGYPEYKLFVNNPDAAIYPTSPRPSNPTVTTSCSGGVTTFTLRVDQAGFGVVFIDGDRNNLYDRTQDRILEKPTVIGDNAFVWNGKTDAGTPMNQTTLSVTFSSGVGPVNFPIWDCEQAPTTGISVQDVRPGNDGASDYIFWNDSLLGPSFSNPYINPVGGNTPATSHRWSSNAGDEKLVNSYAVGLLARGNAIQIAYDPAATCASAAAPVVLQPLPVQLVAFGAEAQAGGVAVRWQTASETQSAYFEVERSLDGQQFVPVGRVAARGSSTTLQHYRFQDTPPARQRLYYRLHQVDLDGTGQYSRVETVAMNALVNGMELYPNPATATLNVHLPTALSGPVTLRVLDATGRVVWQQQQHLTLQRRLALPVASLPSGHSYLLQVQTAQGSVVQRFVK